jgi:hypothetical protein
VGACVSEGMGAGAGLSVGVAVAVGMVACCEVWVLMGNIYGSMGYGSMAGKSPNLRSCTVYLYGLANPVYVCVCVLIFLISQCLAGLLRRSLT